MVFNNHVYEICKRLQPLIKEKADTIWFTYKALDEGEKKLFETELYFYAVEVLGKDYLHEKLLLQPPNEIPQGKYFVGNVTYAGRILAPFGLDDSLLTTHVAVLGTTGTGKTTLVQGLIDYVLRNNEIVVILDWKDSYRPLILQHPNFFVFTIGPANQFFFNPLECPPGVPPSLWERYYRGAY